MPDPLPRDQAEVAIAAAEAAADAGRLTGKPRARVVRAFRTRIGWQQAELAVVRDRGEPVDDLDE